MIVSMTRLTIAVPDELADRIRAAAGGNVSAWLADLARDALLREEAAAVAAFERDHADPAWDAQRWAA
jgi:hypothetical protein